MSLQPINLGTPNNNDGDSLYAGGVKINANLSELYTGLGGSSSVNLKVAVGLSPATSTLLAWSSAAQAFVPASSNSIRSTGAVGVNSFVVTNNTGVAGNADGDLSSVSNTALLQLEGRGMLSIQARNNSSTATTRGSFDVNVGNANVTSLSVYTTSVVARGIRGLEVYRASAEDTASYTKLLDSTSTATGITLYQTPVNDFASMAAAVRQGTDSSNAIAHTGFVKLLLGQYPLSSTLLTARRGLVSTNTNSNLNGDTFLQIDGIYHPKHCEGLIYNYSNEAAVNKITLVTGAACHWSYNTSGVAGIAGTTSTAMVASYTPIIRTFTAGWTPEYNDAGTTPAVIDSSMIGNTWYYLYYLGALQTHTVGSKTFFPGSSNVVVSSNRDIASVESQLAAAGWSAFWGVVRRLGPIRTNATGTAAVPFNVKRIDHGAFEYYWGLNANGAGAVNGSDTSYTTTIPVADRRIVGSSATFSLQTYSSAILTTIPPIPGITAFITVKHQPTAGGVCPPLYLYGDSWTVNSSISALFPPFEVLRSTATSVTNIHQIQVPMIPDGCYIPDGTYAGAGILAVTTSTGLKLRYLFQNPTNEGVGQPIVTSTLLQFTVTGFRYAR